MEVSRSSPALPPSTGAPQLPATATAERSLTPLFPELSTTSALELVVRDPQHPEAVSILVQELIQQRREMGVVVRVGQQLQGRVVVQSMQLAGLKGEVAALKEVVSAQNTELVALRNNQKKQAFKDIADKRIGEYDAIIGRQNLERKVVFFGVLRQFDFIVHFRWSFSNNVRRGGRYLNC